jgi:membrane fusion protein, multidrug efflux system
MKKFILGLSFVLLLSVLAACSGENDSAADDEQEKDRAVAVETEEAVEKDLVIEKSIYGRTAPNHAAPITVQAPGEVKDVRVENGEEVKDDNIIIQISTAAGNQNVRATTDGEVINLLVNEGDTVNPEEPVAMVADLDTIKIEFSVTKQLLSLLSEEDKVNVLVEDKEYEATVTNVGTLANETGLYSVIATVDNEEREILPGVVADIHIPEKKVESAILVPTSSIVSEDTKSFIFTVKDNVATKQEVKVLETESDVTAIEGKVKAGDQVVTTGQLTLTDGAEVNVTGGE